MERLNYGNMESLILISTSSVTKKGELQTVSCGVAPNPMLRFLLTEGKMMAEGGGGVGGQFFCNIKVKRKGGQKC